MQVAYKDAGQEYLKHTYKMGATLPLGLVGVRCYGRESLGWPHMMPPGIHVLVHGLWGIQYSQGDGVPLDYKETDFHLAPSVALLHSLKEASSHVMSCPVERPVWQGTGGVLGSTAMEDLRHCKSQMRGRSNPFWVRPWDEDSLGKHPRSPSEDPAEPHPDSWPTQIPDPQKLWNN